MASDKVEVPAAKAADNADATIKPEALALYACPQGHIVRHPTECHSSPQTDQVLPKLSLES